jgi:hypothetical protein
MNRLRDLNLKLPDVKVPLVLSDLFHDLRDRRLLPLVALILVALLAVPFLLSDSGSGNEEESASSAPEAGAASAPRTAKLTVVRTDHGLRQPRKRLGHRTPKDPFEQQYTGPAAGSTEVTQTATPSSTTTSTTVPTEAGSEPAGGAPAAPPSSTSPTESPPPVSGPRDGEVTVFTFAADLKIGKTTTEADGGKSRAEPETREHVLPGTTLPGKKTQVVTYFGISPKTKKPLFLVGEGVTSIFGEAECLAGAANCQLLEVEQGFPVTLLYGPNDVRYKVTVLDVEPVATGHF